MRRVNLYSGQRIGAKLLESASIKLHLAVSVEQPTYEQETLNHGRPAVSRVVAYARGQ